MKGLPSRIVAALYDDLSDRPAINKELLNMEDEAMEEMIARWKELICQELVRQK